MRPFAEKQLHRADCAKIVLAVRIRDTLINDFVDFSQDL